MVTKVQTVHFRLCSKWRTWFCRDFLHFFKTPPWFCWFLPWI